jgi:hypothetical protein
MEETFNIYERFNKLENDFASLRSYVLELEKKVIDTDKKAMLDVDDDLDGFYTISQIVLKYCISRASFYNYQKLVPLKKYKIGNRKIKYNREEVKEFFMQINQWRQTFNQAS